VKIKNIPLYIQTLTLRDWIKLLINYPYYKLKVKTNTRFIEKIVNDYRILIDMEDEGISKQLMLLQTREKDHIMILEEELSEGMVVFDLGANIGYYATMMAKLVGETGKVYAVEPSKANFHLLNLNIKLNNAEPIVDLFNVGISNETGVGDFYESEKSNWHTFYPKVHSGSDTESLVDKAPVKVPIITVGDFAKDKRNIDLIRMDIEGFEVEVFQSIIPLLEDQSFGPSILFEVHQPRYDDNEHNMRTVLEGLFEKGYHVKTLVSNQYNLGGKEVYEKRGYTPEKVIKTDFMKRGFYVEITNEDAIYFMCDTDFTRAALLQRK
jgi:FkbM family methyltransferase